MRSDELPGDSAQVVAVLMSAATRIAGAVRLHWETPEGGCAECHEQFPCHTYRILAGQL
jgi:hypothetical protein